MTFENTCAAPMAVGGGAVDGKAVGANLYPALPEIATPLDIAVSKLTARWRISVERARVTCVLSGLGGSA